jgi:hypothetical protein
MKFDKSKEKFELGVIDVDKILNVCKEIFEYADNKGLDPLEFLVALKVLVYFVEYRYLKLTKEAEESIKKLIKDLEI